MDTLKINSYYLAQDQLVLKGFSHLIVLIILITIGIDTHIQTQQ